MSMAIRDKLKRYFLTKDGILHPEHQLTTAYYFATGNKASHNLDAYYAWLDGIMGIAVVKILNIDEVEFTPEFVANQRTLAFTIYSDRYGVTVKEAKRAIDQIGGVK